MTCMFSVSDIRYLSTLLLLSLLMIDTQRISFRSLPYPPSSTMSPDPILGLRDSCILALDSRFFLESLLSFFSEISPFELFS